MIFHASLPAREPERCARVLAELWGGEAIPFAPVPDAWVAMAGDGRGSAIELYPPNRVIIPGDGEEMFHPGDVQPRGPHHCTHLAVATSLSAEEVIAIGAREGWRAVRCARGDLFEVIEFFLENATMIEVMTPEMQRDYRANAKVDVWKAVTGP